MSLMNKLIVPLLDEVLVKEDFDPISGFVDAYSYDKNRPNLDNHTFLMYDLTVNTKEFGNREARFAKLTNLYSTKVEYINGKPYKIFAFTNINTDIKNILKGEKPKNTNSVVHILSFWRGYDTEVNNAMLTNKPERFTHTLESVPEYDFRSGPFMGFGYKKSGAVD